MKYFRYGLLIALLFTGLQNTLVQAAEGKQAVPTVQGIWKIEVNGHPGLLEFSEKAGSWTASLKLEENGKWEPLENVSFDDDRKEIRFFRPLMDQSYLGKWLGDDLSGTFKGEKKFSLPWKASRKEKSLVGPQSCPLPLVGTWKMETTGFQGVLEFAHHGKSWTGRLKAVVNGTWETLENVVYDFKAGEVNFNRPLMQQKFRGFLRGKRISGTVKNRGIINPWKGVKK